MPCSFVALLASTGHQSRSVWNASHSCTRYAVQIECGGVWTRCEPPPQFLCWLWSFYDLPTYLFIVIININSLCIVYSALVCGTGVRGKFQCSACFVNGIHTTRNLWRETGNGQTDRQKDYEHTMHTFRCRRNISLPSVRVRWFWVQMLIWFEG